MRVLVTGGRRFHDRNWLHAGLDLLHSSAKITEVIEGGAPGADVLAHTWALSRRIHSTTVLADWTRHGAYAGPIRNHEMADMLPDVVLACPGGRGTAHMVTAAKQRGLRVIYLERMPVKPSV